MIELTEGTPVIVVAEVAVVKEDGAAYDIGVSSDSGRVIRGIQR